MAIVDHALERNRDNGDLWCLHGRCLLAHHGREQDADGSFNKAFLSGSRKRELFANWIKAKRQISDWQGIIDVLESKECCLSDEEKLLAQMKAREELGLIAKRNRMGFRADTRFRDALLSAVEFMTKQVETTEGNRLLVATFAIRLSGVATESVCETRGDFLEVFEVIQRVWACGVFDVELLTNSLRVLNGWWSYLSDPSFDNSPSVQNAMRLNNSVQVVRRCIAKASRSSGGSLMSYEILNQECASLERKAASVLR
ncbi:MAG: hypothetical protein JNM66_30345 [Bryobacterales bacterium]|nr:hypothetical protein [Bryobacterales bacterium]